MEEGLKHVINSWNRPPIPFSKKSIQEVENHQLLEHWTARFLQRHPQYVVRKQKPLATERKNAHKLETFQTHFEDYRSAKVEKGIHDEDIYNFDETGF